MSIVGKEENKENCQIGENPVNIQGNHNHTHIITNHHYHTTVITNDVKTIIAEIMKISFNGLPEKTLQEIVINQKKYTDKLIDQLGARIDNLDEYIYSPEFQYTLKKSLIIASKSNSDSLHNYLILFMINKIKYSTNDFIIKLYNQVLDKIESITEEQIKFLTFMMCNIVTLEQQIIDNQYFNISQVDIYHLSSIGCINPPVLEYHWVDRFYNNFPQHKNSSDSTIITLVGKLSLPYIKKSLLTPTGAIIGYAYLQSRYDNGKLPNSIDYPNFHNDLLEKIFQQLN